LSLENFQAFLFLHVIDMQLFASLQEGAMVKYEVFHFAYLFSSIQRKILQSYGLQSWKIYSLPKALAAV